MKYSRWLRLVSLLLVFSVLSQPLAVIAQDANVAMEARVAAERDAQSDINKAAWLAGGCCFGLLAVGAAYITETSPPASRFLGKSPEYVAHYTDAYKAKAKSIRSAQSMTGCVVGTLVTTVLYGAAIAAAAD